MLWKAGFGCIGKRCSIQIPKAADNGSFNRNGFHGSNPMIFDAVPWVHSLRTIRLLAVREAERDNFTIQWRRREQIVGSVLLWAARANANLIRFNPDADAKLEYFDQGNHRVESELGQPPKEFTSEFAPLIRDVIDGNPWCRPVRRLIRKMTTGQYVAKLWVS
jgi:hypothetical protein